MTGIEIVQLEAYREKRGWNARPFEDGDFFSGAIAAMHIVSMTPGSVRGNHVHGRQVEQVVVAGGPCVFAAVNPGTGEKLEKIIEENRPSRITIRPGIPHAFKNISSGIIYLVCAADAPFNPETPDSRRHEILIPDD